MSFVHEQCSPFDSLLDNKHTIRINDDNSSSHAHENEKGLHHAYALFITSTLLMFVPVIHLVPEPVALIWSHIEHNTSIQLSRVLPVLFHLEQS